MNTVLEIARKFEEHPLFGRLCFRLPRKSKMEIPNADDKELGENKEMILQCVTLKHQKQQVIFNFCEASGLVNSTLNGIMEALKNPNISILGIYGSNSERKANLLEKMSRRIKRDYLFDVVAMASVTKKPDLKRIQQEIGSSLGLQFQEGTVDEGASRLCERIQKEERILIVLNDFWGGINFGRIGIPIENFHMGCKVLLVSENHEVLYNQMKSWMNFSE